jgi:drug/metabolite transporter (DMT)-like permease
MIYTFFPFISAALYGLGYVLLERMLSKVPLMLYTFCSSVFFVIIFGLATYMRKEMSFSFLSEPKIAGMFALTILINSVAWITTLLALKNTGAAYVAFAEISYPLFTLLFLYLLFGIQQWNWQSALGSILIFAGSLVLVIARIKTENPH